MAKKITLVSRGVAVVLLVGAEDAGCEHEYVGQKVFKYMNQSESSNYSRWKVNNYAYFIQSNV